MARLYSASTRKWLHPANPAIAGSVPPSRLLRASSWQRLSARYAAAPALGAWGSRSSSRDVSEKSIWPATRRPSRALAG